LTFGCELFVYRGGADRDHCRCWQPDLVGEHKYFEVAIRLIEAAEAIFVFAVPDFDF
jgi:hypothetical protein